MRRDDLVCAAEELPARVADGAIVAVTGSGGGLNEPDALFAAFERVFLETGHPRDLTLVHALGIGDAEEKGLNRFAHDGMVKRIIGGHWSWAPGLQRMARDNMIEAYSLPAGAISTVLRETGAGRPGLITKIGLGTFADPALDGGKCNARARDDLVERIEIGGETYLRYLPLKVDIGLIRGTEADARGNLSLRAEAADMDAFAIALAGHNSGGQVFAQVGQVLPHRVAPARLARVPGILIDALVEAPDQQQSYDGPYDPRLSGETASGGIDGPAGLEMPGGVRRLIAERAKREIAAGASVNFGYGIPGGIPALLTDAGESDYWGSVEQGHHNGTLLDGHMFGAARDSDAIIPSVDQFDFFGGGGLDLAFLGMGELDGAGNVNVSKLGADIVGPGGFIDITQTARKVVFCGTFEAKGLKVAAAPDGTLRFESHGEVAKLVDQVRHVTFSGAQARANGQQVLYVTERAVFRLDEDGVAVVELAKGVDLERDVLQRMGFQPHIRL